MAKKKTAGSLPTPNTTTEPTTAAAPRGRRATTPKSKAAPSVSVPSTADDRPVAATTAASSAVSDNGGPSYDQIAEAAYLRYLKRGGGDGRDFDDWLEAERELKTR
jgi:hypothetical protein